MSDNVALVRRSFEAMSAWDVDELLRLYAPDVEFLPLTGTLVESGGYRGHEGVLAYFAEARELSDVLEPEGHKYHDATSPRDDASAPGDDEATSPRGDGAARGDDDASLAPGARSLRLGPLFVIGGLGALAFAVENAHQSWSALYLRDVVGTGAAIAAAGPAVFAGVVGVTRFATGEVSSRRPRAALVGGALVAGAGTALVAAADTLAVALADLALRGRYGRAVRDADGGADRADS
jgi:ketosteroid isomerase-like protein